MNDTIRATLVPIVRRQKRNRRLTGFARLLRPTAWLVVLIGLFQLYLAQPWLLYAGVAVLVAAPLAAAIWAGRGRPNWNAAAHAIDERYDLKDAVLTALTLNERVPPAIRQIQLRDALQHLPRVRPRQVVPLRIPAGMWRGIVVALLGVFLLVLPEFSGPFFRARRTVLNAFVDQPIVVTNAPPPARDVEITPEVVAQSVRTLPPSRESDDDRSLIRRQIVQKYFEPSQEQP